MSNQLFIDNLIHKVSMTILDCEDDKLVTDATSIIEEIKHAKKAIDLISIKMNKLTREVKQKLN